MKRLRYSIVFACAAAVFFAGCSSGNGSIDVAITGVGTMSENISPDFWSTPPADAHTVRYHFWVLFNGNFSASDLEYARAYFPDGTTYWTLADQAKTKYINIAYGYIGGFGAWMDSDNPYSMTLGPYNFVIKLKNGKTDSYSRSMEAPGSTGPGAFSSMYDPGYYDGSPPPPANSAPMLRYASITEFEKDADSVRVVFNVNDAKVYNGAIWYYSSAGDYVGETPPLRDPVSDDPQDFTDGFRTNGTANIVDIDNDLILFSAGMTAADIGRACVVLHDGGQFEPTTQDPVSSRSISAMISL